MYSKEDILFKALNVQTRREDEYCQKVRPMVLEKIRRMPNSTITMEKFKRAWYEGNDGSSEHYNWTRYYALNLHAVFSKGTLEWRCFESTLHAGKVRSNITLALAISAQAINQSCTHAKKTEIGDNPAFTFSTFMLRRRNVFCTNIVAFTTFPLQFVTITGAICFACSLVLMVYSLVQYFTGSAVEGYTTLLMVLLLVGSAMMISLGIIGYYISKIYEEVKRRPRYIISKVIKNGNIQD